MNGSAQIFGVFPSLIFLLRIGGGIYCAVLFIKFARRGIKALDIYLEEKSKRSL